MTTPITKQPFGINFSAEELANVFATCIFCFNCAMSRAPNDEDALRLSLVRLRLTRWGKAVDIYKETECEREWFDSEDDVDEVKNILVEMMASFEALAGKKDEPATTITYKRPRFLKAATQSLLSSLEAIAAERSGGKSLLCSQSLRFENWRSFLIEEASKLVNELEAYIPAGTEQRELSIVERARIKEEGFVELLDRLALEMNDPWIVSINGMMRMPPPPKNGLQSNRADFAQVMRFRRSR